MCAGEVVAPPIRSGYVEPKPLHLLRDMRHFVERRRDEAGQADEARALALGCLENFLAGNHDSEIDDFEVIALQDHADDVLADVVHVAFHGGHHHLAVGARAARFAALDIGDEHRDRLLHDARRLDHLRQEHLARTEQVAHHVHPVHERAFDHIERPLRPARRASSVSSSTNSIDALDERVLEPLGDRELAPFEVVARASSRRRP